MSTPTPVARLSPRDLRTEHRAEPLGVDCARPRLSWRLSSDHRGTDQVAYRITAARTARDLDDGDLLWDTGRRTRSDGVLVEWDGPRLTSSTRYHWRVEVWAEDGAVADGSATSWFETGLLHRDDWTASWVGRDVDRLPVADPPQDSDRTPATGSLPPPLYLRRPFEVRGGLVRARLHVTARGIYRASLNGQRVGRDELAPGWTEYHERIQYQTHDVTDLVREGGNVLGAVVSDGWWSGYVGFDPRRAAHHFGDQPALLAQLHLEYADGSHARVVTDGEWREGPGEIQYSDLLMGEHVDARRHVAGWDEAADPGAPFVPVAVLDTDPGPLVAEPDGPVRALQELPALTLLPREDGRTIVDFGQNLTGRVRLVVRGAEAGRRIVLRHAEALDGEEPYVVNLRRAEATDVYTAAGLPEEVFEPTFTLHGFRYAEIANHPGELGAADVTAVVVHSDTPWTGSFESSHPLLEQLHSNISWSQRGNFVSVPTDCPQRDERLGWLADAQIFVATASRNADVAAFFARWLRDVRDGQDADGAFRDVSPAVWMDREAAPAWGDGGVVIPWHLWRAYGDRRMLRESLDSMVAWVRHVHRHNPDLLWRARTGNSYGDWLQVDALTPRDVLSTAYFARSAELTAAAAEALGEKELQRELEELHAGIVAAFADAYVDGEGRVEGGTQTAYLLALGFGLVPEHLVESAVAHLVADVVSRGRRLTTGFVGVELLCPVLADHGHAELAYDLLLQEDYPSWGYSIAHGATTIWERWDGWTEQAGFQSASMNSFNHYSLGSVGDWMFSRVAGIAQGEGSVAYRDLLLRPLPDRRLAWARARQETPLGTVECGWSRSDDRLVVEVLVPPSSRAELVVPTADPAQVRLDGAPVATGDGVLGVEPHAEGLRLRLASGRYRLEAPRPA